MKKFRKNKKRICAGILAFVLSASPILNDIPSFFFPVKLQRMVIRCRLILRTLDFASIVLMECHQIMHWEWQTDMCM